MAFYLWSKKTARYTTLDGTLRQSPDILTTAQGAELVLLDMKSERYFTLNDVGSRAWTLLAVGATRAAIVDAIRSEYDVSSWSDNDPVEGDVAALLATLHAAGLVTTDASVTPARR